MDMRRYRMGSLTLDDVRDGPHRDRIVNVFHSEKFNCGVLELESGFQFSVYSTNNRILVKAWGHESDDWIGKDLDFELGHYTDWKADPPAEKETIIVRPVSASSNAAGGSPKPANSSPRPKTKNGPVAPSSSGTDNAVALPSRRDDLDDEIPFN